jgi:hypothetical protein
MRISFEIPSRVVRAIKVGVAVVVVLGTSVALAGVPNNFKDGDPLSAQTMNDNFASLDQRIAKLETLAVKLTSDGGYSTAATYCGSTASTPGDLSNLSNTGTGAVKAKAGCVQACGSSPTAHMCLGADLERSAALGITTSTGWFAAGAYNTFQGDDFECVGWTATTHAGATSGNTWNPGLGGPTVANCTTSQPVLCCD